MTEEEREILACLDAIQQSLERMDQSADAASASLARMEVQAESIVQALKEMNASLSAGEVIRRSRFPRIYGRPEPGLDIPD